MFDFEEYVQVRKDPSRKRGARGFGAYAYAGDVRVLNTLSYARPVRLVAEATVRAFRAWYKADLLGGAVKVSPRQFPHVHRIVSECARELGIPVPTTYITQNLASINAATLGTETDSFILINSATVDRLSDDELRFVIGHECGHIQNSHVTYRTALHFVTHMAGQVIGAIALPARIALNSWSRRAEITCDRAGLMCVKDADMATHTLIRLAHGSQKLADDVHLEDYLKQADELREGVGRVQEFLRSHPYLPKRVKALQLFAESDLYRSHADLEGGRPLADIDREIDAILKVL